ncbi:dnaK protein [Trichomonas vaginalis G3]|uniref:DnaK protein n=1 Tax=Trichomonas vaginalis (strain ATCC PRA-98 / G3) TaxID=412133 RepID=A2F432_TRIV3|nr:ATP binding [Trichomonas vaginalis G3]EAY00333.1 dnaK protein [Trichomonas vaginalis G3]KAI5508380.1 ATP binding [Trichomonas vaginalis G3]|eukprot:XP_001313262.1 dnaK protein [Trichomonas vaginalis G3]
MISGNVIVGIDLGTSNTSCTFEQNGSPEILRFNGASLLPSYIFEQYDEDKKNISNAMGPTIRDLAASYNKKLLFGAKRLLGRNFDHEKVQEFIKIHKDKVDIVNQDNKPLYKITFEDYNKTYYKKPEDVSSDLLGFVRETFAKCHGSQIDACVITVPANFNTNQRRATQNAAQKAGLNCLRLVNEPTAAAFAYKQSLDEVTLRENQTIIVFDFGAGTLDVSVVVFNNNDFVVKYIEGNSDLGGQDFDNILYEYIKEQFKKQYKDVTDADINYRAANLLMLNVEKCKIALSATKRYDIVVQPFAKGIDLNMKIIQSKYQSLIEDKVYQAQDVLAKAIKGAKIDPNSITAVIPIGGTCRTPLVAEMLNSFFNGEDSKKYGIVFNKPINIVEKLSFEHSVSDGAYYIAKLLASGKELGDKVETRKVSKPKPAPIFQDKLANYVGMMMADGNPWWVFPNGAPFPLEDNVPVLNDPWKHSMSFSVIEGKKDDKQFSRIIKVQVDNIPESAKHLITTLKYDENGILEVRLADKTTGFEKFVKITNEFQCSPEEIQSSRRANDENVDLNILEHNFRKKLDNLKSKVNKEKRKASNKKPYNDLLNRIDELDDESQEEFDHKNHPKILDEIERDFKSL